jgi:CDP-glycerol glycerophosphotransferase (TagB/SpsB family)
VAYCAEPLDYTILEPVVRHLDKMCVYVAKNRHTADFLRNKGISPRRMPIFPETVLMARHSAWKFPVKAIRIFGFRHGPYHFKTFTSARNYRAFTLFFLTSPVEEKEARQAGIENVQAVGYPKLDAAFDGTWREEKLREFRREKFKDREKPILLFSATWEKSGMSAVRRWYHRLNELATDYTVCVTLHPWVSKDVFHVIKSTPDVFLVSTDDLLPVMMLADLTISDTSSIVGEFIALDKRIITFRTGDASRKPKELDMILDKAGHRVDSFDELTRTVDVYFNSEDTFTQFRRELREMMFCNLGTTGKRAAEIIYQE